MPGVKRVYQVSVLVHASEREKLARCWGEVTWTKGVVSEKWGKGGGGQNPWEINTTTPDVRSLIYKLFIFFFFIQAAIYNIYLFLKFHSRILSIHTVKQIGFQFFAVEVSFVEQDLHSSSLSRFIFLSTEIKMKRKYYKQFALLKKHKTSDLLKPILLATNASGA